jgi:hypothetical protein
MLTDPLVFPYLHGATTITTTLSASVDSIGFALVDPGANVGKTVRVGTSYGNDFVLTCSRSETKENKPYGTKRSSTRIDFTKLDTNGVPVTGSFQLIQIQPKGSVITEADVADIRASMALFLLRGEGYAASATAISVGHAINDRILHGEG